MPHLRLKNIEITSIVAPQPPIDEGGSSSGGGTCGSDIAEAKEALNVVNVSKKWRGYKNRLKRRHFDANKTPYAVKALRIDDLVKSQSDDLADYWFTQQAKDKAAQA
ncbi:hypothetical protein CCACVL1_17243 [Corchorus capsularis]|uniref:Uncharacterized protein n=1 Tax=Corchorus capsularis TaxID=210143 RepID=A0A1R3HT98_COCAP|nr:hypothetical protein CCACVL1_17243 [Corchorus capsularis]